MRRACSQPGVAHGARLMMAAEPCEAPRVAARLTNARHCLINTGGPRSITAPSNRGFLDAVVRGECPRELEASSQGAPINVSLLRRNEDYVPPEQPRHVAFAGTGRTLAGAWACHPAPCILGCLSHPCQWPAVLATTLCDQSTNGRYGMSCPPPWMTMARRACQRALEGRGGRGHGMTTRRPNFRVEALH